MSTIYERDDLQRRATLQMGLEVECCGAREAAIRAGRPSSGGRLRRAGKGFLFAKRAFDIGVARRA